MHSACVCVLVAALAACAHAWGNIGHEVTAGIADALITKAATANVRKILGEGVTLRSVATWADQVKDTPPYRWSAPLHYIDTPDYQCSYEYTRDCNDIETGRQGACVSGAIANYTTQVKDGLAGNFSDTDKTIPLKFLVHFLGDIHQPLHVGFTTDRGGNEIFVEFYNHKENLHAIWDEFIIARMLNETYGGSDLRWQAELITAVSSGGQYAKQVKTWTKCSNGTLDCVNPFAEESVQYACENSYECVPGEGKPCPTMQVQQSSSLTDDYYNQAVPIINQRIAQGGVRLAALVNYLLG